MSAVLSRSGSHSNLNPTEIARDVICQLATRCLAPTPDNYASVYAEISGGDATHPAAALQRTCDELARTRQELQQRTERVRHLEHELEVTANLVKVDPLTNVLNRRGMNDAYAVEEARCTRSGSPMCVGLIDIDNFKHLNDRLGHQAGDAALQYLAAIMRDTVRPSDVVARFGGEEFVLLLPETPLDEAEKVMSRVQRELTKRFYLHNNERVLITFSAGVALGRLGENRDEHIARADAAMYEAKANGKNRVCRAL